ncbi:A/G-specific adenine glycosylase [Sporolactobacillus spathodeae]|uniref:A/G-specific adenine glycosylase n=1 Tax=Sporolactobacillus spathodeae TaxID=1465502 RepID=UPI001960D228
MNLHQNEIIAFNHELLAWFQQNGRDLPWRRTKNPYYIWVSEVMLQQTQVDTVKPYYDRFITDFATPEALADAPEQSVLKMWEGLGYYSRARNLQQGVREVVEKYDGKLPDDKKKLLELHGIGPYTAGALLSIAFGQPEPAIDGNVMRVMSRVFMIDADIAKAKSKKQFEEVVGKLIAEANPSAFNQALMDLGAMICRPKRPDCPNCPVRRQCKAYSARVQEKYPVKSRPKKATVRCYAIVLVQDQLGRYLIEQRTDSGLLAGFWQFPMVECETNSDLLPAAFRKLASVERLDFHYIHRFSHLVWDLTLYRVDQAIDLPAGVARKWVAVDEFERYPFPVPHLKVIDWLKNLRMNT